jgi:hypothetical protein
MTSRNVGRAGLSPLTHASMCCRATGVDPKTVRRAHPPTARQCIENAREGDNPEVREEMKAIAAVRRRFGVLLERNHPNETHRTHPTRSPRRGMARAVVNNALAYVMVEAVAKAISPKDI